MTCLDLIRELSGVVNALLQCSDAVLQVPDGCCERLHVLLEILLSKLFLQACSIALDFDKQARDDALQVLIVIGEL